MKKIAPAVAMAALMVMAGSAMAENGAGSIGGNVGAGIGGFVTGGYTSSTVSGSYNNSLTGAGSNASSFTAGNQGFADTSVTFGTSQSAGAAHGEGYSTSNNSVATGFTVANQAGTENFGTSAQWAADGSKSTITENSAESGFAQAGTGGLELVGGIGAAGFGSFDEHGHGHSLD